MPKDEWGVKRVCPSCETRFYDLQNDPMTCPNCGAEFTVESLTAKKTTARAEKKPAEAEVVVSEATDDADDVVLDDDDDTDDTADVSVSDELLEDDEDDTVNLEEIADVPADDDES